jgi:hypothetical protein
MEEKSTLKWGPKQLLNCRKPNETRAFMRVGPKILVAGNPRKSSTKTLINRGLKIQTTVNVHLASVMGT